MVYFKCLVVAIFSIDTLIFFFDGVAEVEGLFAVEVSIIADVSFIALPAVSIAMGADTDESVPAGGDSEEEVDDWSHAVKHIADINMAKELVLNFA